MSWTLVLSICLFSKHTFLPEKVKIKEAKGSFLCGATNKMVLVHSKGFVFLLVSLSLLVASCSLLAQTQKLGDYIRRVIEGLQPSSRSGNWNHTNKPACV